MNHISIAEVLSQSVADITVKVAICALYLKVTPTNSMKRRFAETYAQLFQFYRDVLEWCLQSSTSRFFDSFSAKIKTRFDDAVKSIENQISLMVREGDIAGLAILRTLEAKVAGLGSLETQITDNMRRLLEDVVSRQRHNYFINVDLHAREHGRNFFGGMYRGYDAADATAQSRADFRNSEALSELEPESGTLTREEAQRFAEHLDDFISGDEGPRLFSVGPFWVAEQAILTKVKDILAEVEVSRTVWISSPHEVQLTSSAEAAAMGAVTSAWQAKIPMLSFFCRRPSLGETPASTTIEEAALLGLDTRSFDNYCSSEPHAEESISPGSGFPDWTASVTPCRTR